MVRADRQKIRYETHSADVTEEARLSGLLEKVHQQFLACIRHTGGNVNALANTNDFHLHLEQRIVMPRNVAEVRVLLFDLLLDEKRLQISPEERAKRSQKFQAMMASATPHLSAYRAVIDTKQKRMWSDPTRTNIPRINTVLSDEDIALIAEAQNHLKRAEDYDPSA